jgi:hypothetical protein
LIVPFKPINYLKSGDRDVAVDPGGRLGGHAPGIGSLKGKRTQESEIFFIVAMQTCLSAD